MSIKLRELIRLVRQCKSASEERKVIAKELANIRTAFREKDKLSFRQDNVAKLMFVDMLGYPTHFGQMEVLKLLASKMFPEKRLGYLALMQLLDENAEVLMLATQSFQKDMANENAYIVGLALCAFANIASTDISRDLSSELEQLLRHPNPYIRKKALCTAIRVVQRVPDVCDDYFKAAIQTLDDNSQGHGPMIAAVQLLNVLCGSKPKLKRKMRKYSQHVLNRLGSLLRSAYDPDHDIGGVTDPFLQVYLLKLLRTISVGDKKLSDEVDATLAQIATNTESNKNPGNAILYECVKTIMSIDAQHSLHVLAINILGRFLVNRDNNVRYVALNALCDAVEANTMAIQRHRNTIVECLKDADITIRRRALDLVYALTNSENIESLTHDLLGFLVLSASEPEFQQELASKICMVVERYAPNRKWHLDTVFNVLSTVGNFNRDDVISSLFLIISNTADLQAFATYKLFKLSSKRNMESDHLKRLAAWCVGEYGLLLVDDKGAQLANKQSPDDEDGPFRHYDEEDVIRLLKSILRTDNSAFGAGASGIGIGGQFGHMSMSFSSMDSGKVGTGTGILSASGNGSGGQSVPLVDRSVLRHRVSNATKAFVLTALMKLSVRFAKQYTDEIRGLIEECRKATHVELQQRSVEYLTVVDKTGIDLRQEILKPMPVPDIERFTAIDEDIKKGINEKKLDVEIDDENTSGSDSSRDNNSDSDDSENSTQDDDDSRDSSDDKHTRKRVHKDPRHRVKDRDRDSKKHSHHHSSKKHKDKKHSSRKNQNNRDAARIEEPPIPAIDAPSGSTSGSGGDLDFGGGIDIFGGDTNTSNGNANKGSNMGDILDFDILLTNGNKGQNGNTNSSNNIMNNNNINSNNAAPVDDFLSQIMNTSTSNDNNINNSNNKNNTNLNSDSNGLDLLNVGNTSSNNPQSPTVSNNSQISPITAFEKDGVKVTFNFFKTNQAGQCRIIAEYVNMSETLIEEFSFMIAVPKYMTLQIKQPDGTSLRPMQANKITQKIQLTNSAHGQKPLMIRIQVQYTKNGQKVQERAQVNNFPANCAN